MQSNELKPIYCVLEAPKTLSDIYGLLEKIHTTLISQNKMLKNINEYYQDEELRRSENEGPLYF